MTAEDIILDASTAMAKLDRLVDDHDEADRYRVASALYEANLRGLLAAEIPDGIMYRWVVKWATVPERGVHDGNVIDLMSWLQESVERTKAGLRSPLA